MLARWWSGKYSLPPNHPLYQSRTLGDLQREWWDDVLARQQELERQLEDDDLNAEGRRRLTTALAKLDDVLNPRPEGSSTGDPLIDKWEREWAEGKMPNLDEKQER
jgi:hypothetical protein